MPATRSSVDPFAVALRRRARPAAQQPGHARAATGRTGSADASSRWLNASLLLACVVLPLSLFLFKTLSDRQTAIAQAERDAANIVDIFEQHALTTFETYQLVAMLLDEQVRTMSWDEIEHSDTLSRYLSDVVPRYPWIGGISMLDGNGRLRLTTLQGADRDEASADGGYSRAVLAQHDESAVIGQQGLACTGGPLSVACRRTAPDGGFGGVILVSARPSFFIDFWQRAAPQDLTALFRVDGTVLARNPLGTQNSSRASVGKRLLTAIRSADEGSLVSFSGMDGTERLIAYRKVAGFPLYIAHAVSMSKVLRHWRGNALHDAMFFLLAGGGLSLLALAATRHSRREAEAVGLLRQRTNELTSEAERRARAEADLGAVLRDTVERQEAERKHLARELHDSLGQHVAVLHMGLEGILHRADHPDSVRDQVDRLKTTATAVSVEIGRLAWELRPAGLDELGLEAALRSFVETTSRRSGLQIDLHIRPSNVRPSPTVEATLYRVVQEAITNIIKHADASRADIVVEITPRRARVIIEDDGRGFVWHDSKASRAPERCPGKWIMERPGKRLGLLGVRERLSLVGGSLEIESSPGQGATLFIDVPA